MSGPTHPCWTDREEKEDEDAGEFSDEDVLTPSEAKVEQMLCAKLALDATDMGTVPGRDFSAWTNAKLYRTSSSDRSDNEEMRLPNLSLHGALAKNPELSPTATQHSASPPSRGRRLSNLGVHRLRSSPSTERLDENSSVYSPRSGEYTRRSSNLSQVLVSMKKSPSSESFKCMGRDDQANSSPPPPPSSEAATHSLGPRRQSNLTVMRLIAESF